MAIVCGRRRSHEQEPGLTAWLSRFGTGSWRVAWLLFVLVIGESGQAVAAQVAVVMSDDSAPYREVYQAIQSALGDTPHQVSRVLVEDLSADALGETRLAVAVGVRAAEELAALPQRPPVLAVLVPRSWYLKIGRQLLSQGRRHPVSAIFLNQPFERQAKLIRLAFPAARRVGVLLSADQGWLIGELDDALDSQRLKLVHATLARSERLIAPLESILSESDVLLAVPDPLIFNRNTAQSLFLTSYRYRDPVIGYSHSMMRAGALLSLYSSPEHIGRQTAEWVRNALNNSPVRLPPPAYPEYFDISINEQVARSLGFVLPPEDELEKRMEGNR